MSRELFSFLEGLRQGHQRGGQVLEALDHAQKLYRQIHNGHAGWDRKPVEYDVPKGPRTLVEIGALSRIGYVTAKGKERKPREYVHVFETPRPILAWDNDSRDLVIVRDVSRYDLDDLEGWIRG